MVRRAKDSPFAAEYIRRQSAILQGLLIVLNVAVLILIILGLMSNGPGFLTTATLEAIILLFSMFMSSYLLLRVGYFRAAVLMIVLPLLLFQTTGMLERGVINNTSLLTSYLLMVITGLLLGRRAMLMLLIYTGVVSILTGIIDPAPPDPTTISNS